MILKCKYQDYYEQNLASGDAIASLISSANIDYDKTHEKMTSWLSI